MANECVEKLTADPNDILAREKLACLLTERLNQVSEGLEQLILLLIFQTSPSEEDGVAAIVCRMAHQLSSRCR